MHYSNTCESTSDNPFARERCTGNVCLVKYFANEAWYSCTGSGFVKPSRACSTVETCVQLDGV